VGKRSGALPGFGIEFSKGLNAAPGYGLAKIGPLSQVQSGIVFLCMIGIVAAVDVVSADDARAAIRVCRGHVTSDVGSAAREIEAKRAAIRDWTRKAKSAQIPHPSWRIANLKVLRCVPYGGRFDCVAHAVPCTIKQKPPPRRPRKQAPPAAGNAVDT
jgi:hypothetical protein